MKPLTFLVLLSTLNAIQIVTCVYEDIVIVLNSLLNPKKWRFVENYGLRKCASSEYVATCDLLHPENPVTEGNVKEKLLHVSLLVSCEYGKTFYELLTMLDFMIEECLPDRTGKAYDVIECALPFNSNLKKAKEATTHLGYVLGFLDDLIPDTAETMLHKKILKRFEAIEPASIKNNWSCARTLFGAAKSLVSLREDTSNYLANHCLYGTLLDSALHVKLTQEYLLYLYASKQTEYTYTPFNFLCDCVFNSSNFIIYRYFEQLGFVYDAIEHETYYKI